MIQSLARAIRKSELSKSVLGSHPSLSQAHGISIQSSFGRLYTCMHAYQWISENVWTYAGKSSICPQNIDQHSAYVHIHMAIFRCKTSMKNCWYPTNRINFQMQLPIENTTALHIWVPLPFRNQKIHVTPHSCTPSVETWQLASDFNGHRWWVTSMVKPGSPMWGEPQDLFNMSIANSS